MYGVYLAAVGPAAVVERQMHHGVDALVVQFIFDGFRDVFAVEGDVVDRQWQGVNVEGHQFSKAGFLFQPLQKFGANVT